MNSATSRVNPLTVGNSPGAHPAAEASCAATAESSIPGAALARVISFLRLSFISSRRRQYIPAGTVDSGYRWQVGITGGSAGTVRKSRRGRLIFAYACNAAYANLGGCGVQRSTSSQRQRPRQVLDLQIMQITLLLLIST